MDGRKRQGRSHELVCYPSGMQVHASCAARDGIGVLLVGPPGSGKSSLVLRLIARGFVLVADDRVELHGRLASPAERLTGLLEVRGLGVVRLHHRAPVPVGLAIALCQSAERLPNSGSVHDLTGAPQLRLDASDPAAPEKIALALDCLLGRATCLAGALERT